MKKWNKCIIKAQKELVKNNCDIHCIHSNTSNFLNRKFRFAEHQNITKVNTIDKKIYWRQTETLQLNLARHIV